MLGIIGAMDEEVAMIKAQLTDVQVETRAAMDFYKGKLEGKEVVWSVPESVRSMQLCVPRFWQIYMV